MKNERLIWKVQEIDKKNVIVRVLYKPRTKKVTILKAILDLFYSIPQPYKPYGINKDIDEWARRNLKEAKLK